MSSKKEQMKKIVQKLFWKHLARCFVISFSLTAVVLLLGVVIRWKAHQTTWYGEETIWLIWSWLKENMAIAIAGVLIVSVLLSVIYTLWIAYSYLNQVLEATEGIYSEEEIRLPEELRAAEELIVSVLLSVIYTLWIAYSYLNQVLEATEGIYSEEEIRLPEELRAAEEQLNHMKFQLERNVRAAKEAEQRKNDLIVYLAHDLKTPLTSVIGYLTLLRDEGQISEELRTKYLSISLEKAEHLEDLINEFFEITRFNLSTLTLETSRLNLTRMLEQITYEFQPMFKEKELVCTLDVPKDLYVKWDVGKMQRVFDNLLRNAVNYSFEGGEILFSVEESDGEIQMICMNHGNTIPEEKLGRIFEQFFRLDSARATRSGGAGLGLAIAKEIIELHGGAIHAESEEEEIRFIIRIPKEI